MITGSRFNTTAEIARQQALAQQIAQLQNDVSSGMKVHVASDDPAAAARIAQIRTTQANEKVYAANVNAATGISSLVDTSLGSLETALDRAKELMLQASTGTVNASDRAAIVTELQGIRADIATAGTATDSTGAPLYATGSAGAIAIPVGRSTTVVAGESYDQVFGTVTMADGTTSSLDAILGAAIDAATAGDTTAMQGSLTSLGAAQSHVTDARSDAGVRAARILSAGDHLADSATDLATERSGLEDTDVTEAVATLQSKMTTLSAAQSILAKLNQTSLFDKIS